MEIRERASGGWTGNWGKLGKSRLGKKRQWRNSMRQTTNLCPLKGKSFYREVIFTTAERQIIQKIQEDNILIGNFKH